MNSPKNKEKPEGAVEILAPTNKPYTLSEYEELRLERHEVEARVYKCLHSFPKISLRTFSLEKSNISQDLRLDSLERINLITEIEAEFQTLFAEQVFDNFDSVEDIVGFLANDKKAILIKFL